MKFYEPGNSLMTFKTSYVHCLLIDYKRKFCDNCLLERELKQCSICKFMHYCSSECQKQDWINSHKYECNYFKKTTTKIASNDMTRIFIRLLTKSLNNDSSKPDQIGLKSFDTLMDHYGEIKNDYKRLQIFYDMINSVRLIMGVDFLEKNFKTDQLISYFGKMVINSFSISNENEGNIGTAIYLSASSLDHSCDPNCAVLFNGIEMSIKVIKKFDLNQESPAISYTELIMSRKKRQEMLLDNYYFKCKCSRCTSSLNNFETIKCQICFNYSIQIIDDKTIENCKNGCKKNSNIESQVVECIKEIDIELQKKDHVIQRIENLKTKSEQIFEGCQLNENDFSKNIYLISLYELLMDLYIKLDLEKAYKIATKQLFNAYEVHLTRFHPKRELLLVKIIKLGVYFQNQDIKIYINEAHKVCLTNRNSTHYLFKQLEELTFQINSL